MGFGNKAIIVLLTALVFFTLSVNSAKLKGHVRNDNRDQNDDRDHDDHHDHDDDHHHDSIPSTTTKLTTTAPPPKTTVPSTTAPTTTTIAPSPVFCDSEYSCYDRYSPRICRPSGDGRFVELYTFKCPTSSPWCDPQSYTCTAVEPPIYGLKSNFTCMQDGYFPDLEDCSRYYVCKGGVAYAYSCAGKTPFYAQYYEACKGSLYSSWCVNKNLDCSGRSGVKLAAGPKAPDMFVYCVKGRVETVDRCDQGYLFDGVSQTCQPSCPHEGLFPSAQDCTQYYRCDPETPSLGNTRYLMSPYISCPRGQGFSRELYICVDRSTLSYC